MQKNAKRHQQVLSRGKQNIVKSAVLRHSTSHEKRGNDQSTIPINRTHG